ncbi:MAG: helix-turn-helix domain-containing protein [Holosporaceae bacterium]
MQGQQRYKCKECGYNFIDKPRRGRSQAVLALAVWLYLSGLSQRRIARLFGVSTPAVLKWIKGFALKNFPKPSSTGESIAVVELDEMWHFLKKNPAKSGSGRLLILIQDDGLTGNLGIVIGQHSTAR